MSINLALNKPAAASSYVKPFQPSRAVDGNNQPEFRWVCSTLPGILTVDLGGEYWIDRWVVVQMGAVGWDSRYNLCNYTFHGSLDNVNWFLLDTVSNNTANSTDRHFGISKVRFVKVVVTGGIAINPGLASIVELQVYEAACPYLTGLALSTGTLVPEFCMTTTQYTAAVAGVTSITVTPTAEDPQAGITVNGTSVSSGQASGNINLNIGSNTITVVSTSSDGVSHVNYTINITKTGPSANLTKVDVTYSSRSGNITVPVSITDNQTEYSVDLPDTVSSVTFTPYSLDASASILVNNNQSLTSGQVSTPISVSKGIRIPINVTASGGTISKTYGITII